MAIFIDDQPLFEKEEYEEIQKIVATEVGSLFDQFRFQEKGGFAHLKKLKELVIGSGDTSFRAGKNGIWLGNAVFGSAPFSVDMDGNITCSAIAITGGTIDGIVLTGLATGSEASIQGWQFDATFSATKADIVVWTSGTLTLLDGTTYSIVAGTTGVMTAVTYIYLDIAASTTVLQTTTTASNAVGSGKILICVAENVNTTSILKEDWDALGTWSDDDVNGAVSEIDPAGQLYLDCINMTDDGWAERTKDFGSIGTGNYYIEIRFIGNTWDGFATTDHGFLFRIDAGTNRFVIKLGNPATGDGIWMFDGDSYNKVLAKTWDNNWHTVVFYIHNSQTDCDIWVDKDPATEAADITDADCSYATVTDGFIEIAGFGTVAGNGEYHIDYLYIGSAPGSGKNATFQVFGGKGGTSPLITAGNIAANTITANEIAANIITAAEIAVDYIYAGTIDADQINVGILTGFTIRSSDGNDRIELTSGDALLVYDGGTLAMQMTKAGIAWGSTPTWFASLFNNDLIIQAYGSDPTVRFNFDHTAPKFYSFNPADLGTNAKRWTNVYADNYPASPIQVAASAIKVFRKITKIAHKGNKYTLETEDLPKEFKMKDKEGKEHTELKRSVGLCVQGIMELIDEVDKIKNK